MKIKIEKIYRKEANTKYGPKMKILVLQNKIYYAAWENDVSSQWKVGQEIDVEVKSREWEGKTYYDIILPKQSYKSAQQSDDLQEIKNMLGQIMHEVLELKALAQSKVEPF